MTDTLLPPGPATPPIRRRPDAISAAELFQREGTSVGCSANEPLRLSATDEVWWVVNESVDLFLADLDGSAALGPRRHMATVPAGAAFFSISPPAAGKVVVAVGAAGTELLHISNRKLRDLVTRSEYADAVSEAVASWTVALSIASSRGAMPRTFREIAPATPVETDAGDRIMPRLDLVWIRTRDSLSFLGSTPIPDGTLFPLTSRTWVEATGSAEVVAADGSAWLESPDRWEALATFQKIALRTILAWLEKEAGSEGERLTRKRIANHNAMQRSISDLVSVLTPAEAGVAETEGDEPLLAALRLVGAAGGMRIVSPPPAPQGTVQSDPAAAIARASRLRVRRVALRGEWWREEHGPLLAFVEDDKRPIALLPAQGGGYEAVDTTRGTRSAVTRDDAASLEQFAMVLYRPLPEKALAGRDILRFAGFGTAGDARRFLAVGIGGGLLMLLTPIATGAIFNTIIPGSDRAGLAQLMAGLIVAAVTMSLFQITRDVAVLRIEGKVDGQLQAAMWDRVLSLPVPFFRGYSAGDLAQRTMAVNSIRELLSNYVVGALTGGMFSILTFALLFYYDWLLALVATAIVLMAVGVTALNALLQLKYQRPLYALQGALAGLMFQFIVGIAKLRVAGAETRAFAHWSARFAEQKRLSNSARDTGSWVVAANSVFPVLASIAVFAWIGLQGDGRLDIGSFTAFYAALGSFLASMLAMSSSLVSVMGVIPIWERATPILRAEPEADTSKTDPGELSGDIEVNHVSFRYGPNSPPVLNDVSIHAAAGEFVAVVGASGSGKSTLLRLLLAFEEPEAGAIYFDQQDLAGIDVRAVRRQIGVVLQSGQLMPGDIFMNIVGASSLTIEDAMRAADMAGLTEDLEAMPMGVHTVISEGGSTFSGGQKQRLMIARAVVNRPRILLFDEATSALDNRTQAIVSRSLESLKATRLVIAHRLSTIIKADRIYVFDKGRVVQTGTYDELILQDGLFAELARRQML